MNFLHQMKNKMGGLRGLSPAERRQQLWHYFHTALCVATRQDRSCPYCGNAATQRWGKSAMLLELRQCPSCRLRFTWPRSGDRFNRFFYNWIYDEKGATDMPEPDRLPELVANKFRGTSMDFSARVSLVKAVCPGGRLLDYGASWGYATLQFRDAGFDATGFEPSVVRAAYGRTHLGVNLVDDLSKLDGGDGSFDVVFSSHVFEHLSNPRGAFEAIARALKPGGRLVAFMPNCGGANAQRLGLDWGPMYGAKHVLSLDADFFRNILPNHGFSSPMFFSEPYDPEVLPALLSAGGGQTNPPGDELMVVARKL